MSLKSKNKGGVARSQRQLRVGEELRHGLAEVLSHHTLSDPLLYDLSLTVTEVRVSPDLQNATAFVIPLGGAHTAMIVKILNKANGYFRKELAAKLHLRSVPRIGFEADASFDEAEKIKSLLYSENVARDWKSDKEKEDDDKS